MHDDVRPKYRLVFHSHLIEHSSSSHGGKRRASRFYFAFERMCFNGMIEIKALNKTYKTSQQEIVALRDINITIADGEIFGIIGLSGAGKSTLVRCINLLERPSSGEVLLDGQSLTTLSKKELLKVRQNIGMIFQGFNLLEQRTVLGNICFALEIAGVGKEEAVKRAKELLALVGLQDREKSYPSQLSGGQKQRVAIARALATRPRYLLCDEATSALDPNTTRSILELLKEINQTLGVTIVVITHEMRVIDQICDRVAVIDKSRIAEIGKVSDVFTNPQSDIARELILPKDRAGFSSVGGQKLRIIFAGERFNKPLISELVLDCQVPINILFADTREVEGIVNGQMIIELPSDERQADKVLAWLRAKEISFRKED